MTTRKLTNLIYHELITEAWAKDCGRTLDELKKETERSIRTRHNEATIRPADAGNEKRPAVYTLSLPGPGGVEVFYSIENQGIVVRGYAWDIGDREPYDLFDGGGYVCENSWFTGFADSTLPPAQKDNIRDE